MGINKGSNIWLALAADLEQYILFHEKRDSHAAVKNTERVHFYQLRSVPQNQLMRL